MQRTHLPRYVWFVGAAALLLALAGGGAIAAYGILIRQWESPTARSFAGWTHIPAARVGKQWVPYTEYLAHLDAERRFLSGPAARAQGIPPDITSEVRAQALDRAMRIAALDDIAASQHLVVTPLDVDRAYDGLVAQAGTSTTPEEIHNFLNDQFGWDEADFKLYVVRPALMEDVMKQKKYTETQDVDAFEKELQARLQQPDVVKYLKFN